MCVCMYICVCVCVCVYIYIYICMYVFDKMPIMDNLNYNFLLLKLEILWSDNWVKVDSHYLDDCI